MNWTTTTEKLAPYVPAIVALITSIPVLIGTLIKRKADIPTSQAEAVSTLVNTMRSMYDPLNERVRAAEAELAMSRRIDRVQREIIHVQTDFCAYVTTGVKVLSQQLRKMDAEPNFIVNGEMAEYRQRLDRLFTELREIDAC